MASKKKSDQDLIAQVVRELEAAGEAFTFDPAAVLLGSQTTAKQPRLGPGSRMDPAETKRAVDAFGPAAVAALGAAPGRRFMWRGNDRIFWICRIETDDPTNTEIPIVFDGDAWRDAPPGPARLGAILATLTPDLADDRTRDSVLFACDHLVGRVVHTARQAQALTTASPGEWDVPPVPAPAELTRHFEPPHVAGGRFVFCVNVSHDLVADGPSFVRLSLDMDSLQLEVQRLCRGQGPGVQWGGDEGRAFVDDEGRRLVASVRDVRDHTRHGERRSVSAWRQAAAAEQASIASFARATLELMAIGAPLSLVARSQQAALDEVRHARLSLAVARRLDGDTPTVAVDDVADDAFGALPVVGPRAASRALVATTTLLEAAVPETLAALAAGVAARRCRHDDVRAVLDEIHADETRHAELAWDIVDWCVAGDHEARAAVAAVAATITAPPAGHARVDDDDDGQLCAASEQRAFAVAFSERVRPRLQALTRSVR